MNNPSAILPVAPFPPTPAMFQVGIHFFVGLICRLVSMFTLLEQLIQRFYAHRAIASFMPFNANNLRSPFFYRKPVDNMFLNMSRKFHSFWIIMVTLLRFPLSIICCIFACCSAPLGYISAQFSTYCRGMNPNFVSNLFCLIPILGNA
jgi:hypothetical protein